jgi:demethylmenaquinone methyltransferase/2-methoxy-6-polyprenyl-1,4-benzoquinol methylase
MSGDPRIEVVNRFFSGTGSTYDRIVNLWTVGFDLLWKKRILARIPERPARILDQACGTGILTFKIAQKFPFCHVIGVELRDEYLIIAKKKAEALKIANVEFILGRAEDVLLKDRFDCITSSYLAKYAELDHLIRNAKKMLRDGGLLAMHDFTYPRSQVFAWIWEHYFKLMQTAGSWKYPQWRTVFYELPEFLRKTEWVTDLVRLLRERAFQDITTESLTFGTSAIVTANR